MPRRVIPYRKLRFLQVTFAGAWNSPADRCGLDDRSDRCYLSGFHQTSCVRLVGTRGESFKGVSVG